VREVVELREHERRALVVRQVVQVCEHFAQVCTPLDLVVQSRRRDLDLFHRVFAAVAQERQAAVAGHRVEPRLEAQRPLAGKLVVGSGKHMLDRVLGLRRVGEHVAAEGEHTGHVALVQEFEGALVSLPGAGDELVVPAKTEEGLRCAQCSGSSRRDRCSVHVCTVCT
jgi:hypothetical protein